MKRRRLSDLYVKGRELAPNDGDGEPVTVWMAKLNELDRESAIRRAHAVKARYMIDADDEDSETFAAAYAEVRDIEGRDELVTFVVADDITKARRRIEAEHALDEDTWGKEDYLQGLLDAWHGDDDNPGLNDVQEEDPDDPEVKRVWSELERFREAVNQDVKDETERIFRDWEGVDIDTVRRKAAHKLLELRGTEEFVREFRRQQLFYALRDPVNRRMRYFQTVTEVDDLDDGLRGYLLEQYESLTVDRVEGKDSPPPEDSSNSSASEDQPSGLQAVPA